jgi:hypothetical protein
LVVSCLSIIIVKFTPLKDIHTSQLDILSWFPYGHEVGETVFDLSIAYIMSCIFYFIVVYIPDIKKRKSTMTILNKRIDLILEYMGITLEYFSYKYQITKSMDDNSKREKFNGIKTLDNNKNMNFYYQYFDKNTGKIVKLNTGVYTELMWMKDHLILVRKNIDEIFKFPAITSADHELIIILEKINKSTLHRTVSILEKHPSSHTPELGNDVYRYYLLYKALSEYIEPTVFTFNQDPITSWWDLDIKEGARQYREHSKV